MLTGLVASFVSYRVCRFGTMKDNLSGTHRHPGLQPIQIREGQAATTS